MALFRIFSDSRVTRYYNLKTFTDPDEALRLLHKRYDRFWQGRGIRWAIVPKGHDELVGSCGFNSLNYRTRVGELGYELARPYWQRGIMSEAVGAIVGYGFHHLPLNRIEAWVMPQNHASANLLLKLGFQSEGILEKKGYWHGRFHDLELFSLLAEQWHTAPK
jgi:ribosomal-protein-alanine N-acetyltransferase